MRFDLGITPYCIKTVQGSETKRWPTGMQGNVTVQPCAGRCWGGDMREQRCSEEWQRLIARHGEDGNTGLFNSSLQLYPLTQRESKKTGKKVGNEGTRILAASSAWEITASQWLWKPYTIQMGINNLGKTHIKDWISLRGSDRWTPSLG